MYINTVVDNCLECLVPFLYDISAPSVTIFNKFSLKKKPNRQTNKKTDYNLCKHDIYKWDHNMLYLTLYDFHISSNNETFNQLLLGWKAYYLTQRPYNWSNYWICWVLWNKPCSTQIDHNKTKLKSTSQQSYAGWLMCKQHASVHLWDGCNC